MICFSKLNNTEKQSVVVTNGKLVQVCGKVSVTLKFQDVNNVISTITKYAIRYFT